MFGTKARRVLVGGLAKAKEAQDFAAGQIKKAFGSM
jgi:hypothetical protein